MEVQGAHINVITDLRARPDFGLKWRYHFYNYFNKNYQYERTHCYARQFAEQVNKNLSHDADFIISTFSPPLAYIKSIKPVLLYTDATFHNLAGYYDHFSRMPLVSKKQGDTIEKMAYKNSSAIIFSSQWAADTAIGFYNAPTSKIQVVPFGANLNSIPPASYIYGLIEKKSTETLKLLWAGVEFKRKGGEMVLKIAEYLINTGIKTSITFVGVSENETGRLPPYAKATGFLSKNKMEDAEQIGALFSDANFFILPTLKDCTPIVFSEAAAYGLPSLSYNIAGISQQIIQGKTGLLLSVNDKVEKWALAIIEILKNDKLKQMSYAARRYYDEELNWVTSGKRIIEIAEQCNLKSKR